MRTLLIAIVSLALYTAHSAKANDWGVFLQGPGGGAYYSHGRPPPSPRYYYRGPPVVVVPQPYGYGSMYASPPAYAPGYGGVVPGPRCWDHWRTVNGITYYMGTECH